MCHPRFLSHVELQDKYGIQASFLHLLQIRSAIPCSWKQKLIGPAIEDKTPTPLIISSEGVTMELLKQSSKSMSHILIKYLQTNVTSQARWNEIFPTGEPNRQDYWEEVYNIPYKSMRDTKFQAFQFRIIHCFLPCNKYLHNIKILHTGTCTASDTIEHFLFSCPIVQVFWKDIVLWFDREADVQLNVSLRAFLFGKPTTALQARIINFLLVYIKFYIYRQLLQELHVRLQVEKYLNLIKNKPSQFNKWRRIYSALGQ